MMRPAPIRALGMVLAIGLAGPVSAQPSGEEILNTIIDAQRGGEAMRGTITMTVTRPDRERTYQIEMVSDGGERSLIRVVAPARDADQAFLRDGDNLYLYNPRLGRTLRLPPSGQSDAFLGSDLSYNDLAGRDMAQDYAPEVTGESDGTIELTLTPREGAATPYGRLVLTAQAESYAPLEYVYFDQREQPVRRLAFSEFVTVDDLEFPTRIEVENVLERDERTVMVISDYEFGADVPDDCFTERALESGC